MSPAIVLRPFTEIDALVSFDGITIVTLYSAVVSPSAAVTTTSSSFSPTIRLLPPKIWNVASAFRVSTTTSTEVTFASASKESPSETSEPLMVKDASSVFELKGTINVMLKSENVRPSAAVTVTVRVFSPTTRLLSPFTS